MYAQLGNIVFEGLYSPQSFTENDRATFAEHALLNRKPLLEPTGLELKELNIGLLLRQDFCVVAEQLTALTSIRTAQKPVPLIWGTGENMGMFVITEQDKEILQQLPDGTLISARVNLRLKEYVEADPIKRIQKEQKQNAQAVKQNLKKKAQVKKTNKPTCAQGIAKQIGYIDSETAFIGAIVRRGVYNTTVLKPANMRISVITHSCGMIMGETNLESSCAYNDIELRTQARFTQQAAEKLRATMDNPVFYVNMRFDLEALEGNVKLLKMKANKYIVNSITRKG